MSIPDMEHFADSIPNDNTYMSQICSKIFTFSNSTMTSPELSSVADSTCQHWFLQALEHCTEIILSPTDTSLHAWLFNKMLNLRYLIFPKKPVTSVANTYPHIKINPGMLKKSECNQLFLEVAKDYIDIAPKYSTCVEETFFLLSVFKGFFGLLMLLIIFMYVRSFAIKRRKCLEIQKTFKSTEASEEEQKILEMMRLVSIYSFRTQRIDKKFLRLLPDLYDAPTIAINVKRNRLSEALCCLVKSEPVIENFRNGVLVKPFQKDRRYVLHRINGFLKRTSKCRLIIEMDLESSDSDGEALSVQPSFSGGDFNSTTIYDNTAQESTVETSSACSGCYSPKERVPKQERYYSSRQRQIHSGLESKNYKNSIIRKVSSHAACLARNDSSNSVTLIPNSSSTTLKKNSHCSIGRGRGVKISRF